jgi:hypothetical protein
MAKAFLNCPTSLLVHFGENENISLESEPTLRRIRQNMHEEADMPPM